MKILYPQKLSMVIRIFSFGLFVFGCMGGLLAQTADLNITKTVSNAAPSEGNTIEYRIRLQNNGPSTATNVLVKDVIPNGLSFVAFTQQVAGTTLSLVGDTVYWNLPSIANGVTREIRFTVQVQQARLPVR